MKSSANNKRMRLEKYIATAGIASRRAAKKAIHEGRVTVNGAPVFVPGHPIDANTDCVACDGKRVTSAAERLYVMLHKPAGYVTTRRDERGRPTVMDLVQDISENIYPVGRLDLETEGLLLFTNDGDFAYRLTHPRHEIPKTYLVWVDGSPSEKAAQRLREGVTIRSGKTAPAKVFRLGAKRSIRVDGARTSRAVSPHAPLLHARFLSKFKVILHEGKKRQVRLMFKAVGHRVVRLKRIQVGELRLGNLPLGKHRLLSPAEVAGLGNDNEV